MSARDARSKIACAGCKLERTGVRTIMLKKRGMDKQSTPALVASRGTPKKNQRRGMRHEKIASKKPSEEFLPHLEAPTEKGKAKLEETWTESGADPEGLSSNLAGYRVTSDSRGNAETLGEKLRRKSVARHKSVLGNVCPVSSLKRIQVKSR